MAYDRYDTRNRPRDERSHWRDEPSGNRDWDRERGRGGGEDRGFFERAGEQLTSWFGGGDDDDRGEHRGREGRSQWREPDRGRERGGFFGGGGRDHDDDDRFDRSRGRQRETWSGGDREHDRGYRPMAGDYGRGSRDADSEGFFAASGIPRRGFGHDDARSRDHRFEGPSDRDDYRRTSYAGSADSSQRRPREQEFRDPSQHQHDPHYAEWRRRHIEELDSHYDEYRREHQSKFESDFGGWREKRQTKRQMLGQIKEHMQVVGSDEQPVGTVDRVAGDRIILTKSDPQAGGAHHSLSCTHLDRIEGDRVILDCSAEQAQRDWRDEDRGRALFEREDQGSEGPHILDQSFEGTYRR